MNHLKLIITSLLLTTSFVEAKSNDALFMKKTKYEMYSDPMSQLIKKKIFLKKIKVYTGCNTGFANHAIKYEVKNKELFVSGIHYRLGKDCKRERGIIDASEFFGVDAKYPVKANWFSGKLNFGEDAGKIGDMRKLPKLHTLRFKDGDIVK